MDFLTFIKLLPYLGATLAVLFAVSNLVVLATQKRFPAFAAKAARLGAFVVVAEHVVEDVAKASSPAEAIVAVATDVEAMHAGVMPVALDMVALKLKDIAKTLGFMASIVFVFVLAGCTPTTADVVRSAADVANGVAQFESAAAPVIHERCTAPMQAIAKLGASEDPADKAKALAKKCDPIVEAYDTTRRAHIQLLSLLGKLASGSVTIKDVFAELEQLTTSAAQLEKEIATP